jgi:hypothetical protein
LYEFHLIKSLHLNSSIQAPRVAPRSQFIEIPITSIGKIEKSQKKQGKLVVKTLEIQTLFGRQVEFSFRSCSSERGQFFVELKRQLPVIAQNCFAFAHFADYGLDARVARGISKYDFDLEFMHLIRSESNTLKWRVTTENVEYELCETYPNRLIVPVSVEDITIRSAAQFRIYRRIPVVSWIYRKTEAVIIRSSTPVLDRNLDDEDLLKAYSDANPNSPMIHLFDVRSRAQLVTDAARGRAIENSMFYPFIKTHLLELPKLSELRNVWGKLQDLLIREKNSPNWYSLLDQTRWLHGIRSLLASAIEIATLMDRKGNSVLLHCRTGYHQSAQLSSLTQILLSPTFRSIRGFQTLIEREWVSFGFPFASLSGSYYLSHDNTNQESFSKDLKKVAPLFLQFLECVWQLMNWYPTMFDFNSEFLVNLALAPYQGLFGTFLCDNDKERAALNVAQKTVSFWEIVFANQKRYQNPFYVGNSGPIGLEREISMRDIKLWHHFYDRWEIDNSNSAIDLDNAHWALMNENFDLHQTVRRFQANANASQSSAPNDRN